MPMDRQELLNAIIDDGITEIPTAYPRPNQDDKRRGGIDGLESCRMLTDKALLDHYQQANKRSTKAMLEQDTDYGYHRMYALQIKWVLNVLSSVYHVDGRPTLIPPTVRGLNKAVDILGVAA